MKSLSIIVSFLTVFALSSCRNNNKKISTNFVNNPASAQNTGKEDDSKLPKMMFEETVHDFGNMIKGEVVHYSFNFKNAGKSDLLISHVSTSCGCTVSEYPHKPLKPGEKGTIAVTFNSKNKRGFQNKSIIILANTKPNRTVLHIKADVKMPENE